MAHLLHEDGTITELSVIKDREFLLIGSSPVSDITLASSSLAARHARIINIGGQIYLQKISSKRDFSVNGERVADKERLLIDGDRVAMEDASFLFLSGSSFSGLDRGKEAQEEAAGLPEKERLKEKIRKMLLGRLDLKKLENAGRADAKLRSVAESSVKAILDELGEEILAVSDPAALYKEVLDDVLGYGPLEDLIEDENVTEIMCGAGKIYVEKRGKIVLCDKSFRDDDHLVAVIERIVSPIGRRIDESSPIVDARLPDGSRVNAVVKPVALDGPSLNIRKFSKKGFTVEDLTNFGSLNRPMADFLKLAVENRRNIIISGGTGSGKTTLLNLVSSFVPEGERIVTIEDSAELNLERDHVIRLESRPANIEGKGAISIRDLVKNSLRMRPDRIVVGECRGGEALDMLQAMNTGHDGSLTTVHANSPRDVVYRLETMVLMSGMDLPVSAITQQIASAVNIVCQQTRLEDGSRKVVKISEITGISGGEIRMDDIFVFRQTGFDKKGKVLGQFDATGIVPDFVKKLMDRGINVDTDIFKKESAGL